MIISAGLSPAWQHTLVFDTLRLGQVNRAAENAARLLPGHIDPESVERHRAAMEVEEA